MTYCAVIACLNPGTVDMNIADIDISGYDIEPSELKICQEHYDKLMKRESFSISHKFEAKKIITGICKDCRYLHGISFTAYKSILCGNIHVWAGVRDIGQKTISVKEFFDKRNGCVHWREKE